MTLLVSGMVLAQDSSPFHPADDARFKKLERKQTARVVYDVALDGGTVGAHASKQFLPAKSIITRAYYYVVTQFVDSGSGTLALHCEDAGNILTAADITGFAVGSIKDANESGAAAGMVAAIAAPCAITATVAGVDATAGKLIAFIEYVIGE